MDRILIILLLPLLICSCSGNSESEADLFDYSSLEDIPYEVILDIGETEDFIPANLAGLSVLPGGTMLVRDQSQVMIVQFGPTGEFIGVVAESGGGPGELPGFFTMMVSGMDSLIVIHSGGRKDFYGRSSGGLFTHRRGVIAEQGENSVSVVGVRSASEYYATFMNTENLLTQAEDFEQYRYDYLSITDERNSILVDSIHPVKAFNPKINISSRLDGTIESVSVMSDIPYRYRDRFLTLSDGNYMIASNDSSAFYIYNESHELQQKIPLNVRPRPVESRDMEDVPQAARPYITDEKPPFIDVWVSGERIMLHTETYEENKEIVLLNFDGEPLGRFMLPEIDEIYHFRDNRFYTLHRDQELGHSVRVYELEL